MDPHYGFLPSGPALIQLAPLSDINNQLNDIAAHLPILLAENRLRIEVEKLNSIQAESDITFEKKTEQEMNGVILILLMIAQAYIWEDTSKPMQNLPSVIARNLYSLCRMKQRFPTLTYADYVLYNWTRADNSHPIRLNTIQPLLTFTGSQDEAWFIKIHITIEAISGKALHAAHQAMRLAHEIFYRQHNQKKIEKLIIFLQDIAESLHQASLILPKMKEGCDPTYYWHSLRPYLNGWEKIKTLAQTGVKFEGVLIRNHSPFYQFKGASGAQSSIIPALDAALGMEHEIDEMYQIMLAFQQYMPPQHVLFINRCRLSKIKPVIHTTQSNELTQAWENAVEQLSLFRLAHLQLVKEYIYQPVKNEKADVSKITGTGGTLISDYLNQRYNTTKRYK